MPVSRSSAISGIGTRSPASVQNDADDEHPAHDVAEQAHDEGEGAGELLEDVKRNHHPCRLGEGRQIAAEPARANPKDMVAQKTMSAIAASVSIWAVGGSTPGMSDDQFERA